jgi:DNA-binding GntR family transcriptional regulator
VVEAVLSQKLAPGERLGEQDLADMIGVSRTLVREALMQLQARGFVEVRSTRKGWYGVEPSMAEARDAFAARRAVESGMLRNAPVGTAAGDFDTAVRLMLAHIGQVEEALGRSVPGKVDPQERLRATLAPLRPRAAPADA